MFILKIKKKNSNFIYELKWYSSDIGGCLDGFDS